MRQSKAVQTVVLGALLALAAPALNAQAEMVMKILVVNPSETETKQFDIHNPLPPEVKPEHVLNADGLKVDYDSQAGTYVLIGSVTLKPKEAVTKRIILEDVWVIGPERFTALRQETSQILDKLKDTPYEGQGQLLAKSVEERIDAVEKSQEEPFFHPVQHINRYREDTKKLEMVETDLVSLRQLMVMAALHLKSEPTQPPPVLAGAQESPKPGVSDKGHLSVLTTWKLIFIILALLGCVSLSFFLVWQHQLKLQLSKQADEETASSPESLLMPGNGKHATESETPPASIPSRLEPKSPLSP